MKKDIQSKPLKWFCRPWVKLLTFIFITPVWVVIVWMDPNEKKGMKVFASVVLALSIAFTGFYYFGPEAQARRALQQEWNNADSLSRLEMIMNSKTHFEYDILRDATHEEIISMLGTPDKTTDNVNIVYSICSTNESPQVWTCTLWFDGTGKLTEMRTQGRMSPME